MSGFYSPWQNGGGAGEAIGNSLKNLAVTLAQKQQLQRFQQQQMALKEQQAQMQGMLQQAQIGTQHAQAGFDDARTQHQQAVDDAASRYQQAVVARQNGPNFMQGGPTIDNAQNMMLARELGVRALVRGLGGNVDNPPTATINPGQERINTLTGDSLGYLPPNPSFHSVAAGATPFVLNGDQATQQGGQMPFRPATQQGMRPADLASMIGHIGNIAGSQYAPTNMVNDASNILPMLMQAFTNQIPVKAKDTSPGGMSQQGQRIRVKGPNGQTGTMDSSEAVPSGWTVIQ